MSNQPTYPVSERWRVSENGRALEAQLRFPTFKKTWTYNKVFIRWTTHDTGGISEKDVEMAKICDGYAESLGEKGEVADGVTTGTGESGLVSLVKGLPG
ncbi:hypothetical protein INS49_009051 [Diaporthe citri]|uniref:uncharacterized protein n=1 Tax=Diaporthe citri TaxID=83186 RepID=UPI001C7E4EC1|nr:uncharacterized protein INS49_009051 [Diaporthe citri]KAG6363948.1 hypothetical protein INS49_009051 [Diaporthe citri]